MISFGFLIFLEVFPQDFLNSFPCTLHKNAFYAIVSSLSIRDVTSP